MGALKLAALAALVLLSPACGGGSSASHAATHSVFATTFSYANPPLAGYSLQAAAGTNGTSHLVLNLVGPAGAVAQGVSLFLTADPTLATWSKGATTPPYATPGAVFTLGAAPQAFVTALDAAGDLQAGLFQKAGPATYGSAPILSVALDLASISLTPGTPVTLTTTPGQQCVYLDATGALQPLTLTIGALEVQ